MTRQSIWQRICQFCRQPSRKTNHRRPTRMGDRYAETLEERTLLTTFAALPDITMYSGSPMHIPVDGFAANGQNLTYTVTSGAAGVHTSVIEGNRSLRLTVQGYGDMVFELFEGRAPRATEQIIELVESGFYNGITFHRIIDGFVIQGGDPTGTGSGGSDLPNFDDQYDFTLQHNRSGVLSTAKTYDDTSNSQFFVTEAAARWLDYNHTIFGQLVEGESVREAISNVATDENGKPLTDIVITNAEIFTDNQNAVLMLEVPEGLTGSTVITVRATDESGVWYEQSFNLTVLVDTENSHPFLSDIPQIRTLQNTAFGFQLWGNDVEGDLMVFLDEDYLDQIEDPYNPGYAVYVPYRAHDDLVYSVNPDTGYVSLLPQNDLVGDEAVTVAVGYTAYGIDYQVVPVEIVATAAPLVIDASDQLWGDAADDGYPDQFEILLDESGNYQVVLNGEIVALAHHDSVSQIIINGSSDHDTLIVNYVNGDPTPLDGIDFNGGGPDDYDTLVLQNGVVNRATYDFTSASSGSINIDDSIIRYTGLEPIIDELTVNRRTFNFGDANDVITLGDDSTAGNNYSRISSASTSETVYFRNAEVWLTLNAGRGDDTITVNTLDSANKAQIVVNANTGNDTATVYGSTGNDTITVDLQATSVVTPNYTLLLNTAETVEVHGNGGTDKATLLDSVGNDTLVGYPTATILTGTGFSHSVRNVDQVLVTATRGGYDAAYLNDSVGDDLFVASPGSARMQGDNFLVTANGFDRVKGFANNGGNDQAHMHDSAGVDEFTADDESARFMGSGFDNWAVNFPKVYAYSLKGGNDKATLYDSAGDDSLISSSTVTRMTNSSFYNQVTQFEDILAIADSGGYDQAFLYDSVGDDTLDSSPTVTTLTGSGLSIQAEQFDQVVAFSVNGGEDIAYLNDSAGNDEFICSPFLGRMFGDGFRNYANSFDKVYAYSNAGGIDVASIYDSSGDDMFVANGKTSRLEGDGFYNVATNFEEVRGFAINGGIDTAYFHDTAGNDTFVAAPTVSRMEGTGFYNSARGFEAVNAFAFNGGVDTAYFHDSDGDDTFTNGLKTSKMQGTGYTNSATDFEAVNAFSFGAGNDQAVFTDIDADDQVTGEGTKFVLRRTAGRMTADSFGEVVASTAEGETATSDLSWVDYTFTQVGTWL